MRRGRCRSKWRSSISKLIHHPGKNGRYWGVRGEQFSGPNSARGVDEGLEGRGFSTMDRELGALFQRFGSISFWHGSRSGSGSWDPHLGKVDPDPRIHLSVIVDPDPDPWIHVWKKWIRFGTGSGSEYLFFIFFIKKFMSDKLQCLFCYRQNLEKAFLR